MTYKSFIPYYGSKKVREKIEEIEDEAGSIPVIFGVLFSKVIEHMVALNFVNAGKFALASLLTALVYIYRHEMKKAAETVKENTGE
jgi:hypothetical protein